MRRLPGYPLWLGHHGDLRDLRAIFAEGIEAIIDLDLSEPPAATSRELTYCRFPLIDGAGNPPWRLRAAVNTLAHLLRSAVPTLVCCGAGMSRSPAITAIALSTVEHRPPAECLKLILQAGPGDVAPALWNDLAGITAESKDAH